MNFGIFKRLAAWRESKALSLPQYVENLFTGGGSPQKVHDPYGKVDAVFACIMAKWTALDSIPWLLFDANNELIEKGPARQLLDRPHPQITRTQFLAWTAISLDLHGKAFFWVEANEAGTPIALWPLLPQAMRPIFKVHPETGTQWVEAWKYSSPSGKQVAFMPEELVSFRYPHPKDWWDGLPRLAPAELAVSQYFSATEFQAKSFANDGMISGLLTAKQPLTQDQVKAAREGWQATYGGAKNAKKTAVLGSDWGYTRLGLTPQELDFLQSNKWGVQRICMALGVPPPIIGMQGDSQLGAGKENESFGKMFWINTELPLMTMIETGLDSQLLNNPIWYWPPSRGGRSSRKACGPLVHHRLKKAAPMVDRQMTLMFDRDQVTVLTEERNRLVDSTKKYWDMGVPFADLNQYFDLGLPERPWHEQGYLPFSVTPAGEAREEEVKTAAADDGAVVPPTSADPFDRVQAILSKAADPKEGNWQRHNAEMHKYANRLRSAFRSHFVRQRMEMLRKLQASFKPKAMENKSLFLDIIFDLTAENNLLTAVVRPLFNGIFQQTGQEQLREVGNDTSYQIGARAEAALKVLIQNAEEVNRTTKERIKQTLAEAFEAGEIDSLENLAERIRAVYRDRESNGSRTAGDSAAVGAYNSARTDAQEQAGIDSQEWLSARDNRVRPTHDEADGQITLLGEPFNVGGAELRYPGDPLAPIEEIINCRCVVVPVIKK